MSRRRVLGLLAATALVVSAARSAMAVDKTFNVASGDWLTDGNWMPSGVPAAADNVTIPNGKTAQLNAAATTTVANFTLSGGTLTGSGTLAVTGTLTWTGGTMGGSGTTEAQGGLTLTTNATASLTDTRTLQNDALATWSGAFPISAAAGAKLVNRPTGTFSMQTAADFNLTGTFDNEGTVVKSAGSGDGVTQINGGFNNSGTVAVTSGTLALAGGGTQTGSFTVASGARLRFGGGTQTLSGAMLSGAGTVDWGGGTTSFTSGSYDVTGATMVSGGTTHTWSAAVNVLAVGDLVFSAGTLVLSSGEMIQAASYTQSGGTLSGTDTVTVEGMSVWTGGTMGGSGTTNAQGGLAVTTNSTASLADTRTLNNAATATWAGGFPFSIAAGATLTNLPTGTFAIQTSADFNLTGTFNNQGMVVKTAGSGDGITSVAGAFNNSGTVMVDSGVLNLAGGGAQTGSFVVTGGGHLKFGGGTHTLTGVSLSGTGTVDWGGGTTTFNSGSYDVSGTTLVSGGTLHTWNVMVNVAAVGDMVISNGTIALNSGEEIRPTSYTQTGGTVGGTDTVTIEGALVWMGGAMAGSGMTNAPNGLTLTTNTTASLNDTRTLNNGGAMTWAGGFPISLAAGATLVNLPTGTFTIQTSADFSNSGTFTNQGTVVKMAGSGDGVTRFAGAFNNSGTVDVVSGVLDVSGGFVQSAGATRLDGGSLSSTRTIEINGGVLEGSGTVTGNVLVAQAGELSPGLSPGQLLITGAYTQRSGGTLTIEIGGHTGGTDFDQLSVSGTATLAGTLAVHVTGGFTPALGDAFEIMRFGSRSGDFGTNTGLVVSTGVGFRKTYGPMSLTLEFGQEICDDGQDNDGDGLTDCADPKCADFLPCSFTPTTTRTATATPTATPTAPATPSATLTAPSTPPSASPTATPTPQVGCVGDCNHNGIVTIDELIRGVNIALGTLPLDACPEFDPNQDGSVTINELVTGVNNALNGCPGAAR